MIRRLTAWISRLPPVGLATLGVAVAALVAGGGYYAYETYDYIEHNNEFCLSCHLMAEPFERFAQSAHRGLGCKACHQPSLAGRSQMALAQVVEQPTELETHAEVGNEKCAACHIEGDPDQWESIRNSAGHRVHLESDDPDLQGLQCVECHSSSLHQFTASDETCAQSGCHTEVEVRLGGMSDLTTHCAACHAFSAPVSAAATGEAVQAALSPDSDTCLSCHSMRERVDLPPDEPHGGQCGSCHNPHEEGASSAAAESCASAGCHSDAGDLTPFHQGLESGVLSDCVGCHRAHDWQAGDGGCLSCHEDIFEDGARGASASLDATSRPVGFVGLGAQPEPGPSAFAHASVPAQVGDTLFLHSQHRDVDCGACHSMEERHGAVTVTSIADCRSCHHREPVSADCAACHARDSGPVPTATVRRTLEMSVLTRDGDLPMDHEVHAALDCGSCHTDGLELSAADVDCTACHEEHHEPGVRCASCHVSVAAEPHVVEGHLGCAGSECHTSVPFEGVPRERNFCLTCHQDFEDHRVGQRCEDCHTLPEPSQGGGMP